MHYGIVKVCHKNPLVLTLLYGGAGESFGERPDDVSFCFVRLKHPWGVPTAESSVNSKYRKT